MAILKNNTPKMKKKIIKTLALSIMLAIAPPSFAERVGDVTEVKGVRINQLQGFGIVVGLPNTGDRGNFSTSNVMTLIQKYGIKVPDNINLNSRNVAVVMVNANLPAFAKKGQQIDSTVSSLGNAKSLRGGTLLTTPLMGLNGEVYAISQGQILVDGVNATGLDGSTIDINTSSVGRIPMGATVENEIDYANVLQGKTLFINLLTSNFSMANSIEKAINGTFGEGTAVAMDAGSIMLRSPASSSEKIEFISLIKDIEFEPPSEEAKVVINSRTGTVMITTNVTLSPVAISEGNIMINISENQQVSQPNALSSGETAVTSNSQITIEKKQNDLSVVNGAGTLQDLVSALNSIGTGPKDMTNIIQLLRQSGSLKAKVIVL